MFKKRPQVAEPGGLHRQSGRHGMATALNQHAGINGGAHRAAEIDAGNGAARTGADAAVERDSDGGTGETRRGPEAVSVPRR